MLYSGFELNTPEFIEYLTSYGGGYGIAGTYEEPLLSRQDGFFHDSVSSIYKEEEADSTSRPWNENGLSVYDGSGNWLGMFESYFGGCWGEDLFYRCYGTLDTGHGSGLENAEGEEQYGSYYSYDDDMEMQPAYDNNPWSGYVSEFEDSYDYGTEESMPAYSDEMRLCESIFGHWPSLLGHD
uniref:Uncharacterized protein n=1 Tax=Davidia involucrata TaxID=16924 RepID=A0A5B7BDR3_DAVIN